MPASIPDLDAMIANAQAVVSELTARKAAQLAAAFDGPTCRRTAVKIHTDQAPQDLANPAAAWNTEAASTSNADALWALPEHAFWLRAASTAILAGVVDPVPAPVA
jgi:hypothetical protein